MVVYTLASPLMGWLGDRFNGKGLLPIGVAPRCRLRHLHLHLPHPPLRRHRLPRPHRRTLWAARPAIASSALRQLLAGLGIKPVPTPKRPTNLTLDRLTIIPVMILGSFFFLLGSRSLPTAQDRAHEAILSAKPSAPRRSL